MIFNSYIFSLDFRIFLSNGEILNISNKTNYVSIQEKFEEHVMPIFRTKFFINFNEYNKLKNDKNCRFILGINYFVNGSEASYTSDLFETYFRNLVLKPLELPETLLNDDNNVDTKNESTDQCGLEISLVPDLTLNINKNVKRNVLLNSTVTDAIAYLFSDYNNDIYFEKPDNYNVYEQIIINPNNPILSLKNIDSMYGIYNEGLKLFFSLSGCYITSKINSQNTPIKKGDFRDVIVNCRTNGSNNVSVMSEMSAKSLESLCYVIETNSNNVVISNNDIITNELLGNNFIIFSKDKKGNKVFNAKSSNVYQDKLKFYYNKYDNEFKNREFLSETELNKVLFFNFQNLDPKIFTCNKIFRFNFDRNQLGKSVACQIKENNMIFKFNGGKGTLSGRTVFRCF